MKGVLFLCVANSARSQMAEGLARARYGERVRVQSAGSEPTEVRKQAIAVMDEVGIDIRSHASTSVSDVDPAGVDVVVTLCTEEVCPAFLGDARRLHWPLSDPAGAGATEDEELEAFRQARDAIAARLEDLDSVLLG